MRILVVTDRFPYPLTAGYLRHFFLIRELGIRHHITLVAPRPTEADDEGPVRGIVNRLVVVDGFRRSRADHVVHLAGRPLRVHRALTVAARAELERGTYHAVLLAGHRPAALASIGATVPVVADLCDANAERLRGIARHAQGVRSVALTAAAWRTDREETALASAVDRVLFVTPRDRASFLASKRAAHIDPSRAIVIPNGVDSEYWRRTTSQLGQDTVIFTGAMHYRPNHDAARVLIQEVFPPVREQVPGAALLLVGRDPPEWLRRFDGHDGIVVTGSVPDIRPFMERATVFAAPMRLGSGIQNKILEALSMEVPVLTSPLVRAAFGDDPPAPMTVADGSPAFVDAILEALEHARRDASPHSAGRDFVVDSYSWSAGAVQLEAEIADILGTLAADGSAPDAGPSAEEAPDDR